jgi:prevent-host-death family protein
MMSIGHASGLLDLVHDLVHNFRVKRVVNIHEAKTHLSRLLTRVERGDEVIIARAGQPVARLLPFDATPIRRTLGGDKGVFSVPEDFDAPLPARVLADFEG